MHPKDTVPQGKKTNVVYHTVCGEFGEDYVGESQQPLSKYMHQHTHTAVGRSNSAVLDHMGDMGHTIGLGSFLKDSGEKARLA